MEKVGQKILWINKSEVVARLGGEAEGEIFDAEDAAANEIAFLDVIERLVPVL